jgi:uncharacterized SAM-binding protein YcdF (DUF218 family)
VKLLVVLSHLMSKDCELGEESAARADMAIKIFSCNEYDKLVTLGWDYRADCDIPIAEVISDYILKNSDIEKTSVIEIRESRDTVGDAVYCLDFFRNCKLKKIVVVTSDYHVDRTRLIFSHVFNKAVSLEVFGVSTKANFESEILLHEQQSLEAFLQTFKGVDFSSRREMFTALSERHPFYNGKVYPKITYS